MRTSNGLDVPDTWGGTARYGDRRPCPRCGKATDVIALPSGFPALAAHDRYRATTPCAGGGRAL